MCFSADASLASAAVLIPAGVFCLQKTIRSGTHNWVFALLPLLFGIQQAFEGGVWWALETGNATYLRLFALGFLFFSHFFWLAWVPFSCYLTETVPNRRTFFLLVTVLGTIFGMTMFPAFLLIPDWLSISIINHSIHYQTTLLYDGYLPRLLVALIYALIIMLPLSLSSDRYHRNLGGLILLSVMITVAFFDYAFISVWCYFAAVISLYIYYITVIKEKPVACHP